MKAHALPKNIVPLLVLLLAPWAVSSFAKSQLAIHPSYRQARTAHIDLNTTLQSRATPEDERQVDIAPDSVSSELPHTAYLEDETGKPLPVAGTNGCRDLGLYLSYLRERGPPS